MRWFGVIVGIAVFASGAWAGDDRAVNKVVIGNETPLYQKCYENARDSLSSSDALEPCNRALQEEALTRRKTAIVYANRGVVQFNLGDYQAAVSDFTASLDHNINLKARIYANRGLSYEALQYEALARADYQAALSHDQDNDIASRRLQELEKPLYERSKLPRKITAEAPALTDAGI